MNAMIYLKTGKPVVVKDLTTIKKITSSGSRTYLEENFCDVDLYEHVTYAFMGKDKSVSLTGAEILYLEFSQS